MHNPPPTIAIVGLGYVGLPLAVSLAHHFVVTGFDTNTARIADLRQGIDKTYEIDRATLQSTSLSLSHTAEDLRGKDVYIVTVPTPVTSQNTPDLSCLQSASEMIAKVMHKGAIVVFESTVYPGVTEDFCGKILAEQSGLVCGVDFFLGYSPERINQGDKHHTVNSITKVVAGQTPEIAKTLKIIYGGMNEGRIFMASSIKTAEAAKVIENAQRDINIAFVNEITTIVNKLGLSIYDVLDAANTKWNFLPFQPGLVGGHCIGVDPYYLAHCARTLNIEPDVILAGRRINESMGAFMANQIYQALQCLDPSRCDFKILILGLTFKENIPDLRNTKVIDLIQALKATGCVIAVHDACADPLEAQTLLGTPLVSLNTAADYDCIVSAVAHQFYTALSTEDLIRLLKPQGLIADLKRIWKDQRPEGMAYWTL